MKPKRRALGRPTKLTPETSAKIIKAIEAGSYMETAAAYAGINQDTLYEWLKLGARAESEYSAHRQFSEAVKMALAVAELREVCTIGEASKTQWQAAAWLLERRYPGRWGRREAVTLDAQVSGKPNEPVEVEVAGGETVLALLQRLALPPAGGDK